MLTVLRFYFVCCNNCVLIDSNGACYCICLLVALRVSEVGFWPGKTGKNLEILRCTHVSGLFLKYSSDINEKKLATASLLLRCVDSYSCLGYLSEFLYVYFKF